MIYLKIIIMTTMMTITTTNKLTEETRIVKHDVTNRGAELFAEFKLH